MRQRFRAVLHPSRLLLALLAMTVAHAGMAQQEVPRADRRAEGRRPTHVSSWVGNVLIRTEGVRIYVMVDTPARRGAQADGIVDQWFIFETAEPVIPAISAHLGDSLLVHSDGVLEVSSEGQRFEFVVEGSSGVPDGVTTRLAGIGLAHHRAETTAVRIAEEAASDDASPTCMACEALDPDPGAGGGGGTSCSSGGPGTVSCTATQGGYSCTITCAPGRYACCNYGTSVPYCRCVSG